MKLNCMRIHHEKGFAALIKAVFGDERRFPCEEQGFPPPGD